MKTRPQILVIDDDPLFRNLMMTILGNEFDVVVSSEGSEGFQRAIENPPDIAIIDLQMPGWDGIRTLKEIKAHPSLNQVKVVIMTSIATRKAVLEAIQGGAQDYIIKTSFRREEFLAKLLRLLPNWTCEAFDIMKARSPNGNTAVSPQAVRQNPKVDSEPANKPHHAIPNLGMTQEPDAVPETELVDSLSAPIASTTDANLLSMMDNWE